MAKYKVKPIAMSIRGNKVARAGEEVDSSQLIDEKQAVEDGYVELIKDSNETDVDETDVDETDVDETEDEDEDEDEGEEDDIDIDSLTKDGLIQFAADNNLDVNTSAKKSKLKAEIKSKL